MTHDLTFDGVPYPMCRRCRKRMTAEQWADGEVCVSTPERDLLHAFLYALETVESVAPLDLWERVKQG